VKLTGHHRQIYDDPSIGRDDPGTGFDAYLATPERIASWVAADLATPITAEFVIGAYHRLFEIEKSFCMSRTDLQARPIYHRTRDSIEAHLTIVFAALAVSRWIDNQTGWSIRKFVHATRRYRTIEIQAGDHTITAADPLPADLNEALNHIHRHVGAH
jgi:hypothetical protein